MAVKTLSINREDMRGSWTDFGRFLTADNRLSYCFNRAKTGRGWEPELLRAGHFGTSIAHARARDFEFSGTIKRTLGLAGLGDGR